MLTSGVRKWATAELLRWSHTATEPSWEAEANMEPAGEEQGQDQSVSTVLLGALHHKLSCARMRAKRPTGSAMSTPTINPPMRSNAAHAGVTRFPLALQPSVQCTRQQATHLMHSRRSTCRHRRLP